MLAKLLKHEARSQYKVQCGLYAIALILALITFGVRFGKEHTDLAIWDIALPMTSMFAYLSLFLVIMVTIIYAILRYRQNLLRDEGYLMNTLPVPVWQLIASKMLLAIGWIVVDVIVIYFGIGLIRSDALWVKNSIVPIIEQSGLSIHLGYVIGGVLYVLVAAYSSLSQFYVSLSLGYTMQKDKDLMSFLMYIGTYLIGQMVNLVGMGIVIFHDFGTLGKMVETNTVPQQYMLHVFIVAGVIAVTLGIVYNLVSIYALKRKLNLE